MDLHRRPIAAFVADVSLWQCVELIVSSNELLFVAVGQVVHVLVV